MSDWHVIGRISPVPAGVWDGTKTYKRLDIVTDSGYLKSYISLKDVPAGIELSNGEYWHLMCDVSSVGIKHVADKMASPFSETANVVACHPVEDYPLDVKTTIVPAQEGGGDPSPDNIRPISGYESATLTNGGKNVIDLPDKEQTKAGYLYYFYKLNAPIEPGTYTVSCKHNVPTNIGWWFRFENAAGTTVGHTSTLASYQYSKTIEITETAVSVTVFSNDAVSMTDIQLEAGSVASAYEPYRDAETFSAAFGQTVYGGILDWDTGVLTVDKKLVTLDGTEDWKSNYGTRANHVYLLLNNDKPKAYVDCYCSHFVGSPRGAYDANKQNSVTLSGNALWMYSTLADTLDNLKTYLAAQYAAGTPVQVVYEIETPITIQLTPQQILALKGTNTLWSDVGNTSVTGRIAPEWLNEQLKNAIISLGGNV